MISSRELYKKIDELTSQLYFSFHEIEGVIDPISREEIYLQFGNNDTIIVNSVEKAIKEPFVEGKSLEDIIGEKDMELIFQ